jgi:hypothetical protein
MKIQEKDLFHGAALTQIVEHESFKALNKADEKYGHYQVNHDRRLLLKYSKEESSGNPQFWKFSFNPDDIETLAKDVEKGARIFICLVCRFVSVCILNKEELEEVLDLANRTATQWVRVEFPSGGSLHVRGSAGKLTRAVPHNAFPAKVFSN